MRTVSPLAKASAAGTLAGGSLAARAGSGTTDISALRHAGDSSKIAKKRAQARNHVGRRAHPVRRTHQHIERPELFLFQAERFADAALDKVALTCTRGVLARHEQTETRPAGRAPLEKEGVTSHTASR